MFFKPSVTVEPIRRVNPIVEQAVNEIKAIIDENGYANQGDYIALLAQYRLTDEILLPAMQQMGLGFVKTGAIRGFVPQEMIVDLRYVAAAMLLVYSDDSFALKHSVLEYLKTLFGMGTWRTAFPTIHHTGLLDDVYAAYGHHFSDMAMADNAVLVEDENAVNKMALRHVNAMTELAKSDAELTAVYHLALDTFRALNDPDFVAGTGRDRVRYAGSWNAPQHLNKADESQAYNYFWRLALNKILVKDRPQRLANIERAKELTRDTGTRTTE